MKKILFLLIVTFGMITNVHAETCSVQNYTQMNTSVNQTKTLNLGTNGQSNNFTSSINFGNYNYLKGQLWYVINENSTSYSNINWNSTCNQTNNVSDTTSQTYTITYADGTTATISGRITDVDNYCSNYNINGGLSYTYFNPEITTVSLSICTDYFCDLCIVDKNGNFSCPIDSTKTYTKLYWNFALSKNTNVNIKYGLMTTNLYKCNSDAQSIINNQNQNAQQQHQDAQQQYNYISNTTINNQNYTNAQNISDSNTNTQTKSVVMNFWLIPLNFFNSIIASFENTCTQVCVGECGSGHDNAWRFIFPCLDIKGFVGNTIYNTVDAFFAVGMIFAFVKRVKNFFINALMLTNDVASEVSVF